MLYHGDKMSQLKEITDEKWEAFVDKTKHFMEIGTDNDEAVEMIEYMISRGYRLPHVRNKLIDYIRYEVQEEYQVSYRGKVYPTEVMDAIEMVVERYTAVLIEYFNGMGNFGLPIFRRQGGRTEEMHWVDEFEYVDSQVKSLVVKLKNLHTMGQWDGTFNGLQTITCLNAEYYQGDES
tara:strand:- start:4020 stop:4553 length:534 start_codon:yes stop_codon:yes gene_type:complete